MIKSNTIFSPADILLPKFADNPELMKKWAVIACDQFTSEPEYWEKCRELVGELPSAYNYIMPEAYLETDFESAHSNTIKKSMSNFDADSMQCLNGIIYVKRTLPNGSVRHGLVGKIDLEAYNYEKGSKSAVRATEATVIERIPPRSKIRAEATVELPHILILVDEQVGLFDAAEQITKSAKPIYDFDLMLGGGHIQGYFFDGENLDSIISKIVEYESSDKELKYAMGDGNHSLAAAKAHWESLKSQGAEMNHPARYALCELTALSDESLVFEPIYRIVKNCDINNFISCLESITSLTGDKQGVTLVANGTKRELYFTNPSHALTVGTLQNFIDDYIVNHPGVICDYIHGEESLEKLSDSPDTVGFLFDGMDKAELFPYVENYGALPRKTFSMGEAESKRYYLEMRKITE
ncbi:MAG: DUF1015 domain-containing protein [Ruminococcaceae bacterium]|nr:DUF1015 domain-containing protein [Oscillospiraceae bacterium]